MLAYAEASIWSFPEEGSFVGGRLWRVISADITVVFLVDYWFRDGMRT